MENSDGYLALSVVWPLRRFAERVCISRNCWSAGLLDETGKCILLLVQFGCADFIAGLLLRSHGAQLAYIIIRVQDGGGLYVDGNTSIIVRNNNHAPIFNDTGVRLLPENIPVGSAVGVPVGAYDRDAGQLLTFHIDWMDWPAALLLFVMNPSSGQLATAGAVDYEAPHGHSYVLLISVCDNPASTFGTPPMCVAKNITVIIEDRNDAPVVPSENVTLPENVPNGTFVATMQTFDQDRWQQTGEFAIIAGNWAGLFAVDRWSGVVTVRKAGVNFELVPVWNLTVAVTDNGTNPDLLSGTGMCVPSVAADMRAGAHRMTVVRAG